MGLKSKIILSSLVCGIIVGLVLPNFALQTGPMMVNVPNEKFPQPAIIPIDIPGELQNQGITKPDQIPNVGFIENVGQVVDDNCQYYLNVGDCYVYFGTSEVRFYHAEEEDISISAYSIKFLGGAMVQPIGLDANSHSVNYITGMGSWSEVPSYKIIQYPSLYAGIDLNYFLTDKGLKYEFLVHAGANPTQIAITPEGVGALTVLPTQITSEGSFVDRDLLVYQEDDTIVKASFVAITSGSGYGFYLDYYDVTQDLVIDPLVLDFSTYLGGSFDEWLPANSNSYSAENGLFVDSAGYIYMTGLTLSNDFPVLNNLSGYVGNLDIFVTKLNPDGSSLVYSTYIGGTYNESMVGGIRVDLQGNAFVVGTSFSNNFPTVNPFQTDPDGSSNSDIVVFKLNSTGNGLIYSTYLGGTGLESGQGITIDDAGNVYITGYSTSSNYPLKNAYQGYDGSTSVIITKLNATGNGLEFSTYLGGSTSSDYGIAIDIDSYGNVYVGGQVEIYPIGSNFPLKNAWDNYVPSGYYTWEGFIACFNSTGNGLNFSTYIGGSLNDVFWDLKLSSDGYVYVTGYTESTTDFPVVNAYQGSFGGGTQDAFLAKLNPTGDEAVFSTYLGGNGNDIGWDLSLTSANDIILAGSTTSTNLPMFQAFQNGFQGGTKDVFAMMLSTNGTSIIFNSYLGGTGADCPRDVWVDENNCTFIFGETTSSDFPTYNAYQGDQGGKDAFLTKLYLSDEPRITGSDNFSYYVDTTGHQINWTVIDDTVSPLANYSVFMNGSVWGPYENMSWVSGVDIQVNVDGLPVGLHDFTIQAFDGTSLNATDEVFVTVLKRTTNGTWQDISLGNQFITCFEMEVTFAELFIKGIETGNHIKITAYEFNPTAIEIANGARFFEIELENPSVVNFPVTVHLYYEEGLLPAGVSEKSLGIYHLVNGKWVLQGGIINMDLNAITVNVESFSNFAIAPIPENEWPFDPTLLAWLIPIVASVLVAYGCIKSRKGKGKGNSPATDAFPELDFDP